MQISGNTIFITGGGSGIGRGLAEALHAKGNQVIISGRRKSALADTVAANPGMEAVELDVTDPKRIADVAEKLVADFPKLNVLINNAGIAGMWPINAPVEDAPVAALLATNVHGPIRMTSALIEHLKRQPSATIIHVTSDLAFLPLAIGGAYSATKAFLHSYTLSQRYMLKGTSVRVLELPPPYVQTELGGQRQLNDPMAMPLKDFIAEVMVELATDGDEILVERVRARREVTGWNEIEAFTKFNDGFMAAFAKNNPAH